jgi:hypothetical protein
MTSLEGWGFTIKLRPHYIALHRRLNLLLIPEIVNEITPSVNFHHNILKRA